MDDLDHVIDVDGPIIRVRERYDCLRCGNQFDPRRRRKNGTIRTADYSQQFCSRSCGQKSRKVTNNYVKLKAKDKGRAREHRVLMEQHLGRKLFKHEHIHHKNGLKYDNRIENLEIWSHSHPHGQLLKDKLDWCIGFLSQYGYETKNEGDYCLDSKSRPSELVDYLSYL